VERGESVKFTIQIARSLLMGSVGIFFVSIPLRVPAPIGWAESLLPVVFGVMVLYVEAYSWRQLFRAAHNQDS